MIIQGGENCVNRTREEKTTHDGTKFIFRLEGPTVHQENWIKQLNIWIYAGDFFKKLEVNKVQQAYRQKNSHQKKK